ncbi:MAG TPA: tetratricopeptide repeat protein [Gemmatimonadaceae bacterium]|nr:tetratricopeptide repeat protein [Gemmatimonadaceae bacterium]
MVWAIALALAAITIVLYLPVRHYPFIGFDDPGYVTDNGRVKGGLTLDAVRWAITAGYFANWHPLTWISHMVDVQLFGMNAGAHHVTNLALHVTNTLLLFGVLYRMTGALGRSATVAALFAVHPTHVESVAWVSERKDVLSTLFWMLTLWAYWAYTRKPGLGRYLLVAVSFALGLMAKPMLVTLPCALFLLDVWPLRRAVLGESPRAVWLRLIYEKLPLLALAAASSVITFVVQRNSGAVESLTILPIPIRISNAILAYWGYIEKLVWPSGLALLYPYPKNIYVGSVLLVLALLIAITVVVARAARSRPYLLIGWLWFMGTLVPVIGIVQVGKQPMADRYTYLPSIGLFIMLAWGLTELLQRARAPKALAAALSVGAVAMFAVVASAQVERWQSSIDLWEHTIAVTGDNYLAENNLGWDLAQANRSAEAIPHYEASIRLSPRFVGGHTNLALALVAVGRYEEAVAQYKYALQIEPKNYLVHGNLGFALSHLGRLDDAVSEFDEAIRLKSDYVEALNGLGLALARKGDIDGAIRNYNEALRYMPKFPEAHNNLGAALASQGKLEEATRQFAEAIRLKPVFADAHNNFGVALSTQGKLDEAIAQFTEAVKNDPNHAKAHYGLGLALERQGKMSDAAREFSTVLRLQPGDVAARQALDDLTKRTQ